MIQRIQSVFLVLSAISMGVFLFFPLWLVQGAEGDVLQLTAFHLTQSIQGAQSETPTFYLAILGIISIGLSLFSLISFENRVKQIKLNSFNSLVVAATAGVIMYWIMQTEDLMPNTIAKEPGIGFFSLILIIVFNRLATTFIRKDEKLVRDSDRLR